MRVVHVTYDMGYGGAERVIHNLVKYTNPSRYESRVVCLNGPTGPLGQQLRREGIHIEEFNRSPGFDVRLIMNLRHYLGSCRADIVHGHQYTPYVYSLLASARLRNHVIFTEHGRFYPDERRVKRIIVNPILRKYTEAVIAISSATREALGVYENIPTNGIEVIYNGIDSGAFSKQPDNGIRASLGISKSSLVVGTIARMDAIKNHEMMLESMAQIKGTGADICLLIVGDGPERARLEVLRKNLELDRSVIFTGYQEDVRSFYSIMDIFVLTSRSEGTAMTLLEAMACALPCVVTNVGGNPEIVTDGDTGYVVASEDANALTDRLLALSRDGALRGRMGRAARQRLERHFEVRDMVRRYEGIYDRAMRH